MDMVLHGISESFSSAMHILKFLELRSFEKEAAEVQGRTFVVQYNCCDLQKPKAYVYATCVAFGAGVFLAYLQRAAQAANRSGTS